MKETQLAGGISRLSSEARFLRVSLLGSILIILLMAIHMITTSTDIKVTVVAPPDITKDFWISTNGFGPAYLEQMGTFIAYMALNSTPATLAFQANLLKPYLAPGAYGKITSSLAAKRKRFARYQISTLFYPNQISLSTSHCRIQISGELKTFIGNKTGSSKMRKLDIECKNVNGRFYVTSLKLVSADPHNGRAS